MKAELLCLMVLVICVHAQTEYYTSKYDEVNLHEVLRNNRLIKFYYNCMMGWGPCTPEISSFKKHFPEILRTKCAKCSPLQKKRFKMAMEYLMKNKPDMWEGLIKKFDPTRELTKNMFSDPNFLGRV